MSGHSNVEQARILFVDDDALVLAALRRTVSRDFDCRFAAGPEQGLALVASDGPFAVIVTDMRMPGMDGVEFILRARPAAPDTVFLMLSGNADRRTFIDAVNLAEVYRYLSKPVSREDLDTALRGAIERARSLRVEKSLLEDTVTGAIEAIAETLRLVRCDLLRSAERLRRTAGALARAVHLNNAWRVESAALLGHFSALLPPSVSQGTSAAALVAHIRRLEGVAAILNRNTDAGPDVALAADVVDIARMLEDVRARGKSFEDARKEASAALGASHPIVTALASIAQESLGFHARSRSERIAPADLQCGMTLREELRTGTGDLVIAAGFELSEIVAARLRELARRGFLGQSVLVETPITALDSGAREAA